MSDKVIGSVNLTQLEALLQEHLLRVIVTLVPLQVSCLLRQETLVILVYYPASITLHPQEVFLLIEQILSQQDIKKNTEVQMYLIVQGGKSSEQQKLHKNPFRQGDYVISGGDTTAGTAIPQNGFFRSWCLSPRGISRRVQITGIVGSLLGVSAIFYYLLIPPCVLGKCQTLPQAQQLAIQASQGLQQSFSDGEVQQARQQLEQAIALLQVIPWWSSYHTQAQNLLTVYQREAREVEKVLKTLEMEQANNSLPQNPPFPVSRWQEMKEQREKAIADFAQIPLNHPLYSFARRKIQEYQRNLAGIYQGLAAERQAATSLQSAQEALNLAKMRHNAAQSEADWKLVENSWQTALQRLREIPPGTTAYLQGKQLFNTYLPNLVAAGARKQQEEAALKLYNQAIAAAKLAEKSVANRQWNDAVESWRKAIAYLQQVPNNTFQFRQAKALLSTYIIALKQAENRQEIALNLENLRKDLDKICFEETKVCNYVIAGGVVKIELTSGYMQSIWQTALQAKVQSNMQIQAELLNHISQLEQTFQNFSNQTGNRVEVYNSQGELMVTYQPS